MRALFVVCLVLLGAGPGASLVAGPIVGAPYTAWTQTIAGDTDTLAFGMALDTLGSAHFAVRAQGVGVGYLWPVPGGGAWVREEVHARGARPDLDLDDQAKPHMVFQDIDNPRTIYATKTPSGWVSETIDAVNGGGRCKIRVDNLGRVHVVYAGGNGFRYAVRENGSWTIEQVDSGYVQYMGLDIDANGNAHVVYTNGALRYATNAGGGWQTSNLPDGGGIEPDIAVDSTGTPHVAWFRSGFILGYAKLVGGTWIAEVADPTSRHGAWPSIDTDEFDRPHIAYNDVSLVIPSGHKTRYTTKLTDGTWTRDVITPPAWESDVAELRVDADGLPRIAYAFDNTQIVEEYAYKIVVAQPAIRAILPYGVLP